MPCRLAFSNPEAKFVFEALLVLLSPPKFQDYRHTHAHSVQYFIRITPILSQLSDC